jgi:hypothetical protein
VFPELPMTFKSFPTALAGLLFALAAPWAAHADSSASSASSGAGSASVGSSSRSLERSSDSSSRKDDKVAAGDYQVVEIVAVAERPGQLRLKLQPAGTEAGERFYLYVPEATVNQAGIGTGQTLKALARPYGTAFAKADAAQQPFFLVVQDAWLHELPSNPVTL